MATVPQVTISRVPDSIPSQYVVQFKGYKPTDHNLTLYRTRYFATLKAARQYANSRILDAMGIF
jgi:hypothetical protein